MKLQTRILIFSGLLLGISAQAGVECRELQANGSAASWYSLAQVQADRGYEQMAFWSLERALRSPKLSTQPDLAVAVLECLVKVESSRKGLTLPAVPSEIRSVLTKAKAGVLAQYAFAASLQGLGSSRYAEWSSLLRSSPSHAWAIQGLAASAEGNASLAKTALAALFKLSKLPPEVKSNEAELRLALARSHYALGEYASAVAQYQKLFQIGMPMQDALIESAWAHLAMGQKTKALGLAHELQTGKLSKFFAPEAASVQAIALLEGCRFAESRRAVARFSANYHEAQKWLQSTHEVTSLYETAVARAEGAVEMPERVWSIWATSDQFLALQSSIRALFREEREAREWLSTLKDPAVRVAMAADLPRLSAERSRLAEKVEKHLANLNRSMLGRIQAESDRLRMVRVEANQGASRDMIALNANEELRRLDGSLKARSEKKAGALKWGRAHLDSPDAELWIDEIGGFEAKSLDRCGIVRKSVARAE